MAKLADARDLKSRGAKAPCRFDSVSGHHLSGNSGLGELLLVNGCLFCLVAGLRRHVTDAKLHANFLEEVVWRSATRKNPYKVIRNLLPRTTHIDHDRTLGEFHRV